MAQEEEEYFEDMLSDPYDLAPYSEADVWEEDQDEDKPLVERVELFTQEEQNDFFFNVALPVECDPEIDESCLETIDGCGSFGGGPTYYTYKETICDPDLTNWVRIKAGPHAKAGSSAHIWMCLGKHYEEYTDPSPDYARPESRYYFASPPSGMDAACIDLGLAPSTANAEVYYYFCTEAAWNAFFSYLEPDDWDDLRFWTKSTNGLQIAEVEMYLGSQKIYEETGMNYWLDRYYGRQMMMDWRIAKYRHDLVEAVVGTEYLNPILEVGAQDLGQSGSRKYHRDDNEWCSEFAVYAIQHGVQLSSACSGVPTPLEDGDIGVQDMYNWFNGCSRVIPYSSLSVNPSLMKPGYFVSINNRGHAAIFVGWVSTPGGTMWILDGNGATNSVRLRQRSWSAVQDSEPGAGNYDFAGNTY